MDVRNGGKVEQLGGEEALNQIEQSMGQDMDQMQRNFWALTKGVKVKEIEKAQERLTTLGLFGQQQDVVYDDPQYQGSSDDGAEPLEQEVIVIPEDYDRVNLSQLPQDKPKEKGKKPKKMSENKVIETFFMDNFNTLLKQKTE